MAHAGDTGLPPGVNLTNGTLVGPPTAGGNFTFTVQAADSSANAGPGTTTTTYTMIVAKPTLALGPNSLPAAAVGTSYSQALSASGGTGPYTYSLVGGMFAGGLWTGGGLQAGLALAPTGTISGTATAGGASSFSVKAQDSSTGTGPYSITGTISLTVNPPTITVTPGILLPATAGLSYTETLGGAGGTAPYSNFKLVNGSVLPPGLTLSLAGTISGTPTGAGAYNFTVQTTDSSTGTGPYTGSTSFALNVAAPTIVISPPSVSPAQIGANYSQTLTVSGGTAPYSNFTIMPHTGDTGLPAGISLSTTGVLSGTPTSGGQFTFTVGVQDSTTGLGPYTGTVTYTLNVNPPTIILSPTNLATGTVNTSYNQQLSATGGTAPYTNYILASGSGPLPTGLTLTTGGTLVGTPKVAGSFPITIQVQDDSGGTGPYYGTQSYTLTVNQPTITVAPATLNAATVAASYSQTLFGVGGVGPYGHFTVISGGLPAGLTLSAGGTISGIPTAGGDFSVTIQATDSSTGTGPYSGSTNYTLVVNAPTIVVGPATLPNATVAASYSQQLSATGGVGPDGNFKLIAGSLPAGLTLSPGGLLSGTPTAGGSKFQFTIAASDSSGGTGPYSGSTQYTISVAAPSVTVSPASLPNATVAAGYNQQLTAGGGTAPYGNFTVTSGKLPAGLTLSLGGFLSGTPTAGGKFTFTIAATDSSTGSGPYSAPGTQYTLTVLPPTITVLPGSLGTATVGVSFNQTFSAVGGIGPYTNYQVTSGALPAGLTLLPNGQLGGIPTAGGTFSFTVSATDSTGGAGPYTGGTSYSLTVNAPALSISPTTVSAGSLYLAYSQTVGAAGGTGPYTFAIVGGTLAGGVWSGGGLPPGLTLDPLSGTISGAPTADGKFSFTVQATDDSTGTGPYSTTQNYSVTVTSPTVTLAPTPATITASPGMVGVAYAPVTFSASGANAPYQFTLVTGSTLPAGMHFINGVLSGTPTAGGTFKFTVKAADSSPVPFTATQSYTLTIDQPTLSLTSSLPDAQIASAYSQAITLTGGTAPAKSFTIVTHAGEGLPAGIKLSSTGLLTGTPTAGGTFTFTVRATDSSTGTGPYSATQTITLTVDPPNIANTTTNATAQLGFAYSKTIPPGGGTGASHFSIVGGTLSAGTWIGGGLPAGLALNPSTGLLHGAPTVAGTFSFVVQVSDSSTGTGPFPTVFDTFTLVVQQPTTISFAAPLSGQATGAVGTFQVMVFDQYGNPYNGPVTLIAVLNGTSTTVPFTTGSVTKVTAVNGVATFTDVAINTRGFTGPELLQLVALAGTVSVTSSPFTAGQDSRLH